MPGSRPGIPVILVASVLASACAGRTSQSVTAPAPSRLPADSIARIESAYRAHMDSVRRQFTAADVEFMTGMIAHHAQALAMAALIPDRTPSPSIRTLGGRIINAQRDEITLMQAWLRERGQPVPEPDPRGVMMHGMPEHRMLMPGMLSPAQMQELERARGTAFDRLFLTYMIQHHRGAVVMVDSLFAAAGAALDETVFKLANGVQVDQTTEINRMQLMIDALPAPR